MNEHRAISAAPTAADGDETPASQWPGGYRAKRFWRWLSLALPNVSSVMFRQKMTGLAVSRMLVPGPDGKPDRARLEMRIAYLRQKADRPENKGEWRIVNEIELLMVGLFDLPALRLEAQRTLLEAKAIDLPCLAEYAKLVEQHHDDEPALRETLFRLALDVQDKFRKRYLLREFIAAYTARVSLIFSLATTFFILLVIALAWIAQDHLAAIFRMPEGIEGPPAPPVGPEGGMRAFASFYVALAAGLFGAAFSMMSQTKKRVEAATLEDMRTNARFAMLLFRLGVGIGAAMILYFVFDTGLLGDGTLTPKLREAGFDASLASTALFTSIGGLSPNKDLSLLMLWSFVAGFSEVLVPTMLRQAEGKAKAG